jgi:putative flippase GtrA
VSHARPKESLLRSLYERFEHLIHEFAKFGIVGAVALVVNVVGFNVLRSSMPKNVLTATILSTAAATLVAYLGNRFWTYKDRDSIGRGRELVLFFVVNGVAMAIQTICVAISHYVLGINSLLADNVANYVVGMPLGMVFRLWTYRTFIFPKVEEPELASDELVASGAPVAGPSAASVARLR